jgi:hypothetical protein
MAQPLSSHDLMTVSRSSGWLRPALLWGAVALLTLVMLATIALWFHYGTAVFFEMIAAGFAACF